MPHWKAHIGTVWGGRKQKRRSSSTTLVGRRSAVIGNRSTAETTDRGRQIVMSVGDRTDLVGRDLAGVVQCAEIVRDGHDAPPRSIIHLRTPRCRKSRSASPSLRRTAFAELVCRHFQSRRDLSCPPRSLWLRCVRYSTAALLRDLRSLTVAGTRENRVGSNEKTSASIAKIASKGLKAPSTLTTAEIRRLSASALTQVADKPLVKRTPGKRPAGK